MDQRVIKISPDGSFNLGGVEYGRNKPEGDAKKKLDAFVEKYDEVAELEVQMQELQAKHARASRVMQKSLQAAGEAIKAQIPADPSAKPGATPKKPH